MQEVNVIEINEDVELKPALIGIEMKTDDYLCEISNQLKEKIKREMEKVRDKRKDWASYMYFELQKKMKLLSVDKSLDIKKIKIDKHLIAFGNKFVETVKFDPKPKQKTIKESTEGNEEMKVDIKKKREKEKEVVL